MISAFQLRTFFRICCATLAAASFSALAADSPVYAFDVELQQAGKGLGKPHFVAKPGENFVIAVNTDIAVGCFPAPEGKSAVRLTCAIKTFAPGSKSEAQTELIVLRLELGKKSNTKLGSTHADIVMVVTATRAKP